MRPLISRVCALIIPVLLASGPAWSQPQNFVGDITTAIDRGLAAARTVFADPASAGPGRLAALTLGIQRVADAKMSRGLFP